MLRVVGGVMELPWRVQLLGRLRVTTGDSRVPLAGTVARLVALVTLRGAGPRALAASTLWPETPDARAQANLRTALWRLHRLAPGLLISTPDEIRPAGDVQVDVAVLVAEARRLVDRVDPVDAIGVETRLPAGELLPGWYDDWVLLERDRLRQWRLHALEALAGHQSARGRHAEALATAYEAIALEPLRESAHRTLIGVHLAEGNVVEARRHFDALRAVLATELGVEPTRATAEMIPPPFLAPALRPTRLPVVR